MNTSFQLRNQQHPYQPVNQSYEKIPPCVHEWNSNNSIEFDVKQSMAHQLKLQNQQLRSKLLDYQLKERQYVTRIMGLEIELANSDSQKQESKNRGRSKENEEGKEERKFCQAMKKAFLKMFGKSSLKDIWKIQKKMLAQVNVEQYKTQFDNLI